MGAVSLIFPYGLSLVSRFSLQRSIAIRVQVDYRDTAAIPRLVEAECQVLPCWRLFLWRSSC